MLLIDSDFFTITNMVMMLSLHRGIVLGMATGLLFWLESLLTFVDTFFHWFVDVYSKRIFLEPHTPVFRVREDLSFVVCPPDEAWML